MENNAFIAVANANVFFYKHAAGRGQTAKSQYART
jgi:hypothetical protein